MYILGISCFYHDSSAALLKDGAIVAAAQEERFTRKKHDTSFPKNAVDYCLQSQGITIEDIDHIAFYEKPLLKFERVLYQHLAAFPFSFKTFVSSMPSWVNEKLRVLPIIKKKLKYKKDVLFVDHHLAHAASAFLVSPFDNAAILTVDGVGEWSTTTTGIGNANKITLSKHIDFPHSIGLLYSAITAYLGFSVNNSEYKVMGLSPYGNTDRDTNKYYKKLRSIVKVSKDGSYTLDMDYFVYHYKDRMPSKKMCALLEGPIRKPESELTQRHKDIAAAVQLVTEDVLTIILNALAKETKQENLVMAGGVALNSVYNGKILRNTPFKNVWMQPDAGDGGTSIGAAAYVYNTLLKKKRNYVMSDIYLGPSYSQEDIEKFLKDNKIKHSTATSDQDLVEQTAKLLSKSNVIGWFQKGMEWGPRALGARSILSNPADKNMQAILNSKVKHREKFRPFAPVVCADDAPTYFDCDEPVPEPTDYMLMVYPIKKKWQKKYLQSPTWTDRADYKPSDENKITCTMICSKHLET